jgi:tetratricopeptide (TPR) repeat protein
VIPRVRASLAGALLTLAALSLRAQDTATVARPKLALGADSNSAEANFSYGLKVVQSQPEEAVRAFTWASRIDPSSGDVLYALRAAKLLAMNQAELVAYASQRGAKRTHDQLALDSLLYRAYAINPFLFSGLDVSVKRRIMAAQLKARYPKMNDVELSNAVSMRMLESYNYGLSLETQGRFDDALAAFAADIKATPPVFKNKRDIDAAVKMHQLVLIVSHGERGHVFFMQDNMDSALTETTAAIDEMRSFDAKNVVFFYQSKAMFLQMLGMIHERMNHPDLARDAYGAALEEDLSFFPAHSRLAQLDLARNDTTGALSEMELAVQLQPGDPSLRYRYADVLVHATRDADAAAQLRKAIALDPWYGAPHLLLARIADVEQYTGDAIAEYQRYLEVASKTDRQLLVAKARLAELTSTVASTRAKQ